MDQKHLRKKTAWATHAWNTGNNKKNTTVAAMGPEGVLYKQGTAKYAAKFNRTNDTMVECVGFMQGPEASKAVKTLTRPVGTIGDKPERRYQLVALTLVGGGLSTVSEMKNR